MFYTSELISLDLLMSAPIQEESNQISSFLLLRVNWVSDKYKPLSGSKQMRVKSKFTYGWWNFVPLPLGL